MEANPVRIIQYFDGEKQSLIPLFQREYTWGKKNWQSLWDDILTHYSLGPDSSHFMGALVSIPARTVPVGVTKHLIIDGQQRLTTIAVLLCAIRDMVEGKTQDRIQDFLVNRHYIDTADYLKLLPTQADRETYSRLIIDKRADENHSLGQAYEFYKSALSGEDDEGNTVDPHRVLDILVRCLQVVMINLGEADDPYLIFESLNYKGVPLTQADLVRNYVLMKYKHSLGCGGDQERVYKNLWQPLEEATGDNLSEFLRHYASMTGRNVKKPHVYATIKASFAELDLEYMEKKLVEMRNYATHYQMVCDAKTEPDPDVRSRLVKLIEIEVSVCYPLLIQMLESRTRNRISTSQLCECIDMIASFVVRRAACEINRGPMNKMFIRFAGKYPMTGDVVTWFREELLKGERSERWPDDDEFTKALRITRIYGTKPARVILEGLEAEAAEKELCMTEELSIEHIMPQELTDEWIQDLGSDANTIHKELLHTLGNLTLTGYNSELSSKAFGKKLEIYRKSRVALNKDIVQESTWGRSQIEQRATRLAAKAVSIWARKP